MLIVHLFVSYAHVNLCHFFSSSWYWGLAAASACGSSWTFLFTFLMSNTALLKVNLCDTTPGIFRRNYRGTDSGDDVDVIYLDFCKVLTRCLTRDC